MNPSISAAIYSRYDDCLEAIQQLYGAASSPAVIRRLRKEFGDELARLLLDAASLQPKARAKFGEGWWWATDRALQQATPWQVATLKATWMGTGKVFDLCAGIGGDSMALSCRGDVVAVDRDPLLVAMNAANLRGRAAAGETVTLCEDVLAVDIPRGSKLHIDPDRRTQGRRASAPEHYRPAWNEVMRLVERADAAIVKLAPAAQVKDRSEILDRRNLHRLWISLGGTVREQSLLFGAAIDAAGVTPGGVSAVKMKPNGSFYTFAAENDHHENASEIAAPQTYLVDPDSAIRAAGLTETLASRYGLSVLGGPAGFLSAETIDTCALADLCTIGRVLWYGSADDRKIRRELRCRDFYPATIKVRGSDHDPNILTKRYRKCGARPTTMWIGRAGGTVYAAFTEPVETSPKE